MDTSALFFMYCWKSYFLLNILNQTDFGDFPVFSFLIGFKLAGAYDFINLCSAGFQGFRDIFNRQDIIK